MSLDQDSVRNRLLAQISKADFRRIADHLEPVDLPAHFMLAKTGEPIRYGYFLNSGIGSIIVESFEGNRVEAGLFGREGATPPMFILGAATSSCDIFMQLRGEGFRIESAVLRDLIDSSPTAHQLMLKYVQTLATQTAFTALSNALHHVDERLARWLLMCHDRIDGDELTLTHEFMSLMLGVRRPSVTTALHVLEGNQFIRAERGTITIRDRSGLMDYAADVYGKPEREYRDLIGPM